jgi:hypothetical protein
VVDVAPKGKARECLTIFLGIAGVYVGFWGVMKSAHWLYVPCVAMILSSYAIDFAARRRAAHRGETSGQGDSSPHRK